MPEPQRSTDDDAALDEPVDDASTEGPDADGGDVSADAGSEDQQASARASKPPRPGSRMTEQEIRWGTWLGLGSAVAFGVLPQPWLGGQHLYQAGLGVIMGMLLWVVARQGYRIRTAIASYLFLFAFGDLFLFGALHIGYAFLLAFRSSREMGQHRAQERIEQRANRAERPARAKRKRKDGDDDSPAPPPLRVTEPNRRYTPPKPKGKRRR